jgi:Lar family restriction alleviation protein
MTKSKSKSEARRLAIQKKKKPKMVFTYGQSEAMPKLAAMAKCPFCGSDKVTTAVCFDDRWSVDCMDCSAVGPTTFSEKVAIKAWNTRTKE